MSGNHAAADEVCRLYLDVTSLRLGTGTDIMGTREIRGFLLVRND